MHDDTELCVRLVETIERMMPLSPLVRQAFLAVPRRPFVPRYYTWQDGHWAVCDSGDEVYEDRPLITYLDDKGGIASSSSQPSLMALMLEALDMQRGQHVLEIATGTGYNAALIATIAGEDGAVATVDIEPMLVDAAREHLAAVGLERVCVHCGDGLCGYPALAPYDRIIATASYTSVPPAWSEQLTTGGVLVMNLVNQFTSILVRLAKHDDGTFRGVTLSMPVRFMPIQSSTPSDRSSWVTERVSLEGAIPIDIPGDLRWQLRNNEALMFFLHVAMPSLRHRLQYRSGLKQDPASYDLCYYADDFLLAAGHNEVIARGSWQQLIDAYRQWESCRCPDFGAYLVEFDARGRPRFSLRDTRK
jgi:protein-L-isoaspartate(D-aspartate) O-methyltransferase